MLNKFIYIIFLLYAGLTGASDQLTAQELEQWFNDDSSDEESRALSVSDGELEFLEVPPDKPVHHSQNRFTISKASLKTGWVGLRQCHYNLDIVHAAQVVYRQHRIQNLRIESSEKIGKAWVEGYSIQLENVAADAHVCVQASAKILHPEKDGSIILKNSSFHRKFLDGYYPLHVSLDVRYPQDLLQYESTNPVKQTGFKVVEGKGKIFIDTWFEGMLKPEIRFLLTDQKKPGHHKAKSGVVEALPGDSIVWLRQTGGPGAN